MDVQAAFNNTSKGLLARRLKELGVEADLIRWTISFMSDRRVKLVLDGEEGEAHKVETGIPQGSPAAPILFITYLSGIFDEVEKRYEGVKALSFADDISWWAEGKTDEEVAKKLSRASEVAEEWSSKNGVTFDHGKSEAMLFSRKRKTPTATIKSGGGEIPFNKEATRWLGIWLDGHLTLRDHQRAMQKKGRNAQARLRRLMGQMGLTSGNCRKVVTACVQSVAMYGSELWWRGEGKQGMASGAGELQKLVNLEGRGVTGCFRTTNQGALASEAGLRPAVAQLENRQRRFGARLLGLPEGEQARQVVGAPSGIGRRIETVLGYAGRTEEIVLPAVPEKIGAVIIIEEPKGAKEEAERDRPGLTLFTDGSRIDSGAIGYAVT